MFLLHYYSNRPFIGSIALEKMTERRVTVERVTLSKITLGRII